MVDLLLRRNGADGSAIIAETADGEFVASFSAIAAGVSQIRGPENFKSQNRAREWIIQQAAHHGFGEGDFDIILEPTDA